MGNYVSEQLLLFLQSILLGMAIALVYDLAGALRRLGGRLWGGALDVLFCLSAAAAVFLFVMAGEGELRVFMILGIAGGAVLFRCALAGLLRPVWSFWLELVLLPLRWMEKFLKKSAQKAKKACTFGRRWVTIKFTTLRRPKPPERQEGVEDMAAASGGRTARPPQKKSTSKSARASGKWTLFFLVLLLIGISVQIFRMFDQLQEARETEAIYAQQLAELKDENQKLQEDLDNSGSIDLIEDIARDQLGMVREGEKVFHFSK